MREIMVVGMPRAGSEAFHALMVRIGGESGVFDVCNLSGDGKQHISAERVPAGFPILAIWRNLLDALVSAYFYIRDYQGSAGERHPYHSLIEGKSKREALDVLAGDYFRDRLYEWLRGYREREGVTLFEYERVFFEGGAQYIRSRLEAAGFVVPMHITDEALEALTFEKLRARDPVHYRSGRIGEHEKHLTRAQIERLRLSEAS